jgi:hypothetical protein
MDALTQLFHSSGAQRNFVLRAAQANFSILQLIVRCLLFSSLPSPHAHLTYRALL